ncbi:hypothetical protein MHH28_07880 [Paenibacillus sp. FSL K6-1217]|uniref:hypothetical protein n=1 Tax=Paenibacillus sp. FSL K6-1217 TaxID=2921466 RepID=UPI0032513101
MTRNTSVSEIFRCGLVVNAYPTGDVRLLDRRGAVTAQPQLTYAAGPCVYLFAHLFGDIAHLTLSHSAALMVGKDTLSPGHHFLFGLLSHGYSSPLNHIWKRAIKVSVNIDPSSIPTNISAKVFPSMYGMVTPHFDI